MRHSLVLQGDAVVGQGKPCVRSCIIEVYPSWLWIGISWEKVGNKEKICRRGRGVLGSNKSYKGHVSSCERWM